MVAKPWRSRLRQQRQLTAVTGAHGATSVTCKPSQAESTLLTTEPANQQPHSVHAWRVFPAVAIIAIGVLFLLNNLGYPLDFLTHRNWWALFILIAAAAPLTRAYEVYRARGRFDAEAAHYTLTASAIALVAVLFLTDADWSVWWPLFVILGGLFTLVRRPHNHHYRRRDAGDWQHDDGDASFKH